MFCSMVPVRGGPHLLPAGGAGRSLGQDHRAAQEQCGHQHLQRQRIECVASSVQGWTSACGVGAVEQGSQCGLGYQERKHGASYCLPR